MSLISKLRNISSSQVQPIKEEPPEQKKDYKPILWSDHCISKSVYYLRSIVKDGIKQRVFFVYTPTLMKNRGFYRLIDFNDKQSLAKFHDEFKDYTYVNFYIKDGELKLTKRYVPPTINIIEDNKSFYEIYAINNSGEVQINDVLDLLDFIYILGGRIHMNPLKEVPRLTKKVKNQNFKFGELQDYNRSIDEFITSREKPTLSYRYIVKGFEKTESGEEIETHKFMSYSILDNSGRLAVPQLEFTVNKTEEKLYYINKYLKNFIQPFSLGIYKREFIYFIVDSSKLGPIYSLHEPMVSADLIHFRERSRILLKSIKEFKSAVKSLAKRVGTPIYEVNMYSYSSIDLDEEENVDLVYITKYNNFDVQMGNFNFKKILEKAHLKEGMIEDLITSYLDGRIDGNKIQTLLDNCENMFISSPLLREALKTVFYCIEGANLKDMFKLSSERYNVMEKMSNSLKLRLHVFRTEDLYLNDYLVRALSQYPDKKDLKSAEYVTLTFDDFNRENSKLEIKLIVNVKI